MVSSAAIGRMMYPSIKAFEQRLSNGPHTV
jgi:hypothetical protein